MAPAPQVPPSQLAADYGRLLDEADVNDNLHDIVFQVRPCSLKRDVFISNFDKRKTVKLGQYP